MYGNLAQTQKPRKLITLEEFFPKKFFQNKLAEAVHTISHYEIHDKKEDVDHGGPSETLTSLKEPQLRLTKLNPHNPPLHQKKCSPKLLKSQRCTPLIPTCFNKPQNVMRALWT